MRRVQTKQTLKLWLLALVLALAIVWYSLNPTPRVVIRKKREEELPDEKRQNLEPQVLPTTPPIAFGQLERSIETLLPPDEGEDDFEWPEFIDI
ncbi:MAG TPA: hypothetical protein VKB86_08280 [Pyrinomonadaceae bacterium]|nr:hypothetical protein [Pyrinomonadaceae bacterium]